MQSHADPVGLGAIVDDAFLEPRMLQRFLGGDALLGVVDKDLSQQVEELPVEGGVDGNELLQYKCPGQSRSKEMAGDSIKEQLTASAFMARTYLREARVVSVFGQSSLLRLKYLKQEKPELVPWQQEWHSNGGTYFAAELWVPARPCTTCRTSRESIFWPITDSIIARCSRLS